MNLILASLTIAYILLVWLQTDAIEEYFKILWITRSTILLNYLLDCDEQEKSKKTHFTNFKEWLSYKYGNKFIVKLILCPICLSTWLALPFLFLHGFLFYCSVCFLSNLGYFYLSNLMKHLHS